MNAPDESWVRGNWMQTFTGRRFYPLQPELTEIDIEDIAHSLSMQCRYGGHPKVFYSVAEHSVHVSNLVPPEHALVALLHDATEAYLIDLPRPVKRCLPDYSVIEQKTWLVIAKHFDLDAEMPQCVHDMDTAILYAERNYLMHTPPAPWANEGIRPPEVEIWGWPPTLAKKHFMDRYLQLSEAQL